MCSHLLKEISLRTTTHLVRRSVCVAALALLATGVASAAALAAGASPTTLAPSDGAGGDLFGESAATSSDGAITAVGAPEHNSAGAVYVFNRTRNGSSSGSPNTTGTTFSQAAELTPRHPQADEQFGMSVAMSGDGQTLVASAPGAAGAGVSDQGAAYVFTDRAGTWTQIAKLKVSGTTELGTSVAISADASTIVVGSALSNHDNGEAFVYTKSGSTYVRTQTLTASASAAAAPTSPPPAFFGFTTALSSDGSTIAFGEPNVGVTDVFTKAGGASTWTQTAQLPGGGSSVAVSSKGTIVAAGQTGINNLNGAVFVFTKSGGTFTEASEVLPPPNKKRAALDAGASIGMSADGSIIAFGAPTANAGSVKEAGAVFVATETNGTWALTGTDTEPHPARGDDLGGGDGSVAVTGSGSAIVAGARVADNTGQADVFRVS
jgi:FG-GAP repeat protein